MGKVLWVDLGTGSITTEAIPDDHYRRFLSGTGLAARLLIERIRALLRRESLRNEEMVSQQEENKDIITRGDLVLDDSRHICSWKGTPINLTVTEYLLLKSLVLRPGHVKNRDQLIDMAYGENIYVDDRTIDSHIKRIRKKFRDTDPEFSQIETLYGVGYKYKEQL